MHFYKLILNLASWVCNRGTVSFLLALPLQGKVVRGRKVLLDTVIDFEAEINGLTHRLQTLTYFYLISRFYYPAAPVPLFSHFCHIACKHWHILTLFFDFITLPRLYLSSPISDTSLANIDIFLPYFLILLPCCACTSLLPFLSHRLQTLTYFYLSNKLPCRAWTSLPFLSHLFRSIEAA